MDIVNTKTLNALQIGQKVLKAKVRYSQKHINDKRYMWCQVHFSHLNLDFLNFFMNYSCKNFCYLDTCTCYDVNHYKLKPHLMALMCWCQVYLDFKVNLGYTSLRIHQFCNECRRITDATGNAKTPASGAVVHTQHIHYYNVYNQ